MLFRHNKIVKKWHKAHDGAFGALLKDAKVHSELSKHYWWRGMRTDIIRWCRVCLTCVTRRAGGSVKPPLTLIPVTGPFDCVGVDVVHFTKSYDSNQYAVVFMDYLTKWPEGFVTSDQTALTIAKFLVISRHEVPVELLSDGGSAFLSHLLCEVCQLIKSIPLLTTHRLMGWLNSVNRTLIDMLAKPVECNGKDWDT